MQTLIGEIVSTKMQNTVVVRVENIRQHPIYKKIIKRHSRIKADTAGVTVAVGDTVKLQKIRPMSKEKHFKVVEVLKV